jgi:hypothetical protein
VKKVNIINLHVTNTRDLYHKTYYGRNLRISVIRFFQLGKTPYSQILDQPEITI